MGVRNLVEHTCRCIRNLLFSRYYLGPKANIVISDVEMLKQIFVREFDSFINRQVSALMCACISC